MSAFLSVTSFIVGLIGLVVGVFGCTEPDRSLGIMGAILISASVISVAIIEGRKCPIDANQNAGSKLPG
jgi:hypothetical protein